MLFRNLRVFIVSITALGAAFAFSAPLQAQGETYVDLSIEITGGNAWVFTAKNLGTANAYGVTVDIEIADQIIHSRTTGKIKQNSGTDCSGNIPGTTCASGVWSVGFLGAGQEESASLAPRLAPGLPCCAGFNDRWAVPARAVIKNTVPEEEERFRSNNTDVEWIFISQNGYNTLAAQGSYWLEASVDDLLPDAGDTVDFSFRLNTTASARKFISNAQVRLKLDNGMGTPTATPPSGTTFAAAAGQARTWDWNIGTVESFPLNLVVSTTLDAGVTPWGLCLTAELTARPDNIGVRDMLTYTTAEFCFKEDPVVLLEEGQATLFSIYPCVGVTAYPCSSDDTIEMRVIGDSAARAAGIARDEAVLRPERVFVQVKDPEGRRIDSHRGSVNSGTAPSWHTARPAHRNLNGNTDVGGVDVRYTRLAFTSAQRANYTRLDRTVAVAGLDGAAAPGLVKIRWPNPPNAEFEPNPSHTRPNSFFSVNATKFTRFVEFETLGTYKIDYTAAATHNSGTPSDSADDVVYSGTGSYIFHVGPIAELELQDAGANPDVPPGLRAFTIRAVNNGPDDAPDAQMTVTGLNTSDYVSHSVTSGTFDVRTGVWTIGEMREPGYHRDIDGRDGETLTIVTSAAAGTEITAAISNTQDYRVCIDSSANDVDAASKSACTGTSGNTWHTAKYYDYISDNSSVQVKARPGLRGAVPETRPGMVGAVPMGSANLVYWTDSQSGDRHSDFGRRESWDIEYSDRNDDAWILLRRDYKPSGGFRFYIDRSVGESRIYRVRARYASWVGDWTKQGQVAEDAADESGTPGVTVSPTALSLREGRSGSYRVRLDARPSDDVTINLSPDNPDVRLSADRLTFTPSDWSRQQTVTVTIAQDLDTVDETGAINHSIGVDSLAYEYDAVLVDSVAVTIDDDETLPRIVTGGGSRLTTIGVGEGESQTYQLALGSRLEEGEEVAVNLYYPGGQVAASPPRLVFTAENWNRPQTVTITGVQDDDAVDDEAFICHNFSDDYAEDLCLLVVVADDENAGSEVELALSRGPCPGQWPQDLSRSPIVVEGYSEKAGGCFYSLRLNALPTGNVTVTVQASNSSKALLDTTVSQPIDKMTPGRLTFTPDNWREPQEIGFWPIHDDDAADNNDFTISHRVSGGGYNGVRIPDIQVKVVEEDRDRIGFRVEGPPGGPLAVEGDRSTSDEDLYRAVFYMFPETQPMSTVTVAMSSDNPDVTLSPSRLSFTPSNWDQGYYEGNSGKRVLVRAAQDSDAEDETATITFTVTSSDTDYHGMELAPVPVRVEDDDKPDSTGEGGEPGNQESPVGQGTAELTGLTVAPVADQPTRLAVSWNPVENAARYQVRWKTGSGDYGDAQETTTNSYTVTGLSPGTTYTVQVSAIDGDNTLLAEGEASGEAAEAPPEISFVIYHDPNAGTEALDRYDQATALLTDAQIPYTEVTGDVQAEVDRLAGVSESVLPRFFLGDPTSADWVSQPGENNGGLRWLREEVAELSAD